MRGNDLQKNKRNHQKVLVLGERATAYLIAEELQKEGLFPLFQKDLIHASLPTWSSDHYLDSLQATLEEFSRITEGAGIVHPGTTYWAERPELTSLAEQFGLSVIGPSVGNLSLFGNKLNFLTEADQLNIPHLVLNFDPMNSAREIEKWLVSTHQVFPFLLRSVKGGGRFGRYWVRDERSLQQGLSLWCDQLRRICGEVLLFAEKSIEGARQISVPFVRFQDGTTQVFPFLDSSLQSSNRKVIEFCPTIRLSPTMKKQLQNWTICFAEKCGYVGLGVFEFLVDGNRAYLSDGLPRLNTSFYLWERVAGTSAISWQLAALKGNFPVDPPALQSEKNWRTGLSVRIYAEDSLYHLPQTGVVQDLVQPASENSLSCEVKFSLSYQKGDEISSLDSGLFGILFVTLQTRKNILSIAHHALSEFWISGSFQTNERFLLELLAHPWLREGIFHVEFIDEEFLPLIRPPADILKTAIALCEELRNGDSRKVDWVLGDKKVKLEDGAKVSLKWEKEPQFFGEYKKKGVVGQLQISSESKLQVCAYPLNDRWLIRMGSWYFTVRPVYLELPQRGARPTLNALVNGRVHAILYRAGVSIDAHENLLVLECMGVFIPHALPVRAKVIQWKVNAEQIVLLGQELAELEVQRTL